MRSTCHRVGPVVSAQPFHHPLCVPMQLRRLLPFRRICAIIEPEQLTIGVALLPPRERVGTCPQDLVSDHVQVGQVAISVVHCPSERRHTMRNRGAVYAVEEPLACRLPDWCISESAL
jgi:hypothetical protein